MLLCRHINKNVLGYYRNLSSLRYGMSTASRDAVWEKLLFPLQLKSFLITQCNCMSIGSGSNKKLTNGSAAVHKPMAMQPTIDHQNRRGILLYKRPLRHRISDFFEGSDWGVQLIARPGTLYSFHISGDQGYDSNRVRSLSIFNSYCIERRCMGTSTIMPCYDMERLKTKTQ